MPRNSVLCRPETTTRRIDVCRGYPRWVPYAGKLHVRFYARGRPVMGVPAATIAHDPFGSISAAKPCPRRRQLFRKAVAVAAIAHSRDSGAPVPRTVLVGEMHHANVHPRHNCRSPHVLIGGVRAAAEPTRGIHPGFLRLMGDTVGIKIGRFSMLDWFGTPYTEALHLVERCRRRSGRGWESAPFIIHGRKIICVKISAAQGERMQAANAASKYPPAGFHRCPSGP
jgi:hypothetical protein